MILTTEKSIYLTMDLYTPKYQNTNTQKNGNHNNLRICSWEISEMSTLLKTKAKKVAMHIQKKSQDSTINFLFNLEVDIKYFFKVTYINRLLKLMGNTIFSYCLDNSKPYYVDINKQ